MSLVTFTPVPDCAQEDGWPEKAIGDGFINLTLSGWTPADKSATYVDQFGDEYEFLDPDAGKWTVEVLEDGL